MGDKRSFFGLGIVLMTIFCGTWVSQPLRGQGPEPPSSAAVAPAAAEDALEVPANEVHVEVKIGDELIRFEPLMLTEPGRKQSVEQWMKLLDEQDESFRFEANGTGATFFVIEVQGQRNEGRGGKNWFLLIDGKMSMRGAGSTEVGGGSTITWLYRAGGLR